MRRTDSDNTAYAPCLQDVDELWDAWRASLPGSGRGGMTALGRRDVPDQDPCNGIDIDDAFEHDGG